MAPLLATGFFYGEPMTIEIICDGCLDCGHIKGKVCQAVADLNLNAEVLSDHDPKNHGVGLDCVGPLRMRVNGILVSTSNECSVRDLMLLFSKGAQMDSQI